MATLNIGRICIKTAGREAGRYCTVLKKMDAQFVLITGPKVLTGVKRRRCNIDHLEPTPFLIKIKEEAAAKEVIKAYDEAGLVKKFNLRKPSPEIVKEKEKKVKKVEKKPEKKEKPKKEGVKIKLKVPSLRKKKPEKEKKPVEKPKKIEKKPEKKEKPKKEEKPKEKKEGITIKLKIPTLRKPKKPEVKKPKKVKKKPKKVVKKKVSKKKKKK